MKEWWTKRNVIDNLKNHEIDSWSKKKQWIEKACEKKNFGEKNRKKKKKQAEKANSSLNQKARVKSQ